MQTKEKSFFKRELAHAILVSPFDTLLSLFLLVAIQYYNSGAETKALFPAAPFIGFLAVPFLLGVFAKLRLSSSQSISFAYLVSALCLFVVALQDNIYFFVFFACIALASVAAVRPLITSLWHHSVGDTYRGKHYGNVVIIALISKITFGLLVAYYVDFDLSRYKIVALITACALLLASYIVRITKTPTLERNYPNPMQRFGLLKKDIFFTKILVCWFILGFGNLLTVPLRAEYVASGRDFIAYSPFLVILLIEVIPSVLQLLTTKIWGSYFDKVNFLVTRMLINLFFAASIFLFFFPNLVLQITASICFGIARGGVGILWPLWTTKFAPKEKTADYMSLHSFFTGIRGLIAPFLAFWAISFYSFQSLAILGSALFLLSTYLVFRIYQEEDNNTKD